MAKRKRENRFPGGYVIVPKAILSTRAWRAMSAEGRLLWIDVREWLRNDGLNNGKVGRSCRDAAKSLGFHKDTVAHRFIELEHYGFLRKTCGGFLGADGRGIAARYRFTDLPHGTHPPTRDFEKWDGSVCPTASDIRDPAHCPTASDTSRLPLPSTELDQLQGSLTARAPARAGGAGSSPAPVAKEEA